MIEEIEDENHERVLKVDVGNIPSEKLETELQDILNKWRVEINPITGNITAVLKDKTNK